MHNYQAFYRGKIIDVQAETSYKAQCKAAEVLKVKPRIAYRILIVKVDAPVDVCSLPGA